jgi:hypothetical protein
LSKQSEQENLEHTFVFNKNAVVIRADKNPISTYQDQRSEKDSLPEGLENGLFRIRVMVANERLQMLRSLFAMI